MRAPRALSALVAWASVSACGVLLGIEDRPLGDPFGTPDGSESDANASDASDATDATDATNDVQQVGPPPGCDGSPRDRPDAIDERCGIFVSTVGNDTAPGTRALPMRTITVAVRAAIDRGKFRVFACGGGYPEHVEMNSVGASISGGFGCEAGVWTTGGAPTIVRSPDESVTLRVAQTKSPIVFESMRFEAPTATTPSTSSIVAQLTSVTSVTFTSSMLVAAAGQSGANGDPGVVASGGGQPGNISGGGSVATAPAADKSCTCTIGSTDFGTTVGGAGGVAQIGGGGDVPPKAGLPALAGGGAGTNGAPCSNGSTGSNGSSGAGPTIPTLPGTLTGGVWTPTAGGRGTDGTIAQGGGGGGAYVTIDSAYAGGGGGCGGCPSTGSTGGKAGGSSIGIVALDSTVVLVDTGIETAQAGAGGNGAESPSGQTGGAGQGNALGTGCSGGMGGTGGGGGPGGGGAGGVSVGIVYGGLAPTIDAASDKKFVIGPKGGAGSGRIPGPTHFALGPAGVSAKIWKAGP